MYEKFEDSLKGIIRSRKSKDRQHNCQKTDNTMAKRQTTQWPKDRQTTQWPKEKEQKDKQRSTSILTMKLPSGKLCKANLQIALYSLPY